MAMTLGLVHWQHTQMSPFGIDVCGTVSQKGFSAIAEGIEEPVMEGEESGKAMDAKGVGS